MNLYKSGEDYLEAILILSHQKGSVRSVDVADYFNYSRASVSHAVSLLQEGGFLLINGDKTLLLTPLGLAEANRVYERHCILKELLIGLGVTPEVAAQDACEIEHVISQEAFHCIKAAFSRSKAKERAVTSRPPHWNSPCNTSQPLEDTSPHTAQVG